MCNIYIYYISKAFILFTCLSQSFTYLFERLASWLVFHCTKVDKTHPKLVTLLYRLMVNVLFI